MLDCDIILTPHRLQNRNSPNGWKVVLPSTIEHEGQTVLIVTVDIYFSGSQTRDTTDQMMSCRIELTFAARVAAFMCFVLYLFRSAIE